MARELEILDKIQQGKALLAEDKAQIYTGGYFKAPDGDYHTTLMHQLVLLPNFRDILKELDLHSSKTAFLHYAGPGSVTPLGGYILEVIIHATTQGESYGWYKDDLCTLASCTQMNLQGLKNQLIREYNRPDVVEVIELCETEAGDHTFATLADCEPLPHFDQVSTISEDSLQTSVGGVDGLL